MVLDIESPDIPDPSNVLRQTLCAIYYIREDIYFSEL